MSPLIYSFEALNRNPQNAEWFANELIRQLELVRQSDGCVSTHSACDSFADEPPMTPEMEAFSNEIADHISDGLPISAGGGDIQAHLESIMQERGLPHTPLGRTAAVAQFMQESANPKGNRITRALATVLPVPLARTLGNASVCLGRSMISVAPATFVRQVVAKIINNGIANAGLNSNPAVLACAAGVLALPGLALIGSSIYDRVKRNDTSFATSTKLMLATASLAATGIALAAECGAPGFSAGKGTLQLGDQVGNALCYPSIRDPLQAMIPVNSMPDHPTTWGGLFAEGGAYAANQLALSRAWQPQADYKKDCPSYDHSSDAPVITEQPTGTSQVVQGQQGAAPVSSPETSMEGPILSGDHAKNAAVNGFGNAIGEAADLFVYFYAKHLGKEARSQPNLFMDVPGSIHEAMDRLKAEAKTQLFWDQAASRGAFVGAFSQSYATVMPILQDHTGSCKGGDFAHEGLIAALTVAMMPFWPDSQPPSGGTARGPWVSQVAQQSQGDLESSMELRRRNHSTRIPPEAV
jgi:hypothetical protein